MTPTECRPRCGEFLRNGAVEFFGVQRTILADRVAEQQIEHKAWRMPRLAITLNQGAGFCLEISANCLVGLAEQPVGVSRLDLLEVKIGRASCRERVWMLVVAG